MSTGSVAPNVGKTSTERFDIAYGYKTTDKTDKEGNAVKEVVVITPEAAEELSKVNKFEGSVITVSADYPATFEGLTELANTPGLDEDGKPRDQKEIKSEIVKLFNNGAKGKVMNRLRALLSKTDDKGVITFNESKDMTDGVLDLTKEITSGSKRVFLTEEQKTWRSLENLPANVRENMWKVYLTSIGKEFYVPAE